MPARNAKLQVIVTGGLNTELPGGVVANIDNPVLEIPYMVQAENILFEDGGSFRKVGGAIKATAGSLTTDIVALLPTNGHKQVTNEIATEICAIFTDGTFYLMRVTNDIPNDTDFSSEILEIDSAFLPEGTTSVISSIDDRISVRDWTATNFEDYLVLASSDTTVGVQLHNGPSRVGAGIFTQLATGEPHFSMSEVYQNRLWAAGDPDNPSRLYYSDLNDPTQGYSTNFFDIDPTGSSVITGIKAFRDRLFIFKGPDVGSIHVLSGRTPSTFAIDIFSRKIGCVGHNAIEEFADDVMFMDTAGHLRSLSTTDRYGDFGTSVITDEIREIIDTVPDRNQLMNANLFNDPINSRMWAQIPTGPELDQNISVVTHYGQGMKKSTIEAFKCSHVVPIVTADTDGVGLRQTSFVFGARKNFLWALDAVGQERIDEWTRSGTTTTFTQEAYEAYVELPSVKFLPAFSHNNLTQVSVSMEHGEKRPLSTDSATDCAPYDPNIDFTFKWQRDLNEFESVSISSTNTSRLGSDCNGTTLPSDGSAFVIGASRLGGPKTVEVYAELESTDFRRVSFAFEQGGLNEGLHVHSFAVTFGQDDTGSTENL